MSGQVRGTWAFGSTLSAAAGPVALGSPEADSPCVISRFFVLAASALTLLAPATAAAATWGSFDTTRMAYAAGSLEGTAHDELRATIEAAGDTLVAATGTLTADDLAGVDVFYTGMLSGGTGATAGDLGT